jgi:hypothetical protein
MRIRVKVNPIRCRLLWVTGCREDVLPATDGLPSIAKKSVLRGQHWQLIPNFRTNPSSSWHGRNVPIAEIARYADVTQFGGGCLFLHI